jgi:selenocysteine lyase/cysteine desulfurase
VFFCFVVKRCGFVLVKYISSGKQFNQTVKQKKKKKKKKKKKRDMAAPTPTQPQPQPPQGFGSFHNESVEYLIRIPDAKYVPPPLPECVQLKTPFDRDTIRSMTPAQRKQALWRLDPSWTFLNHGAFGAALTQVVDHAYEWAKYVESQPLRFIDRELLAQRVSVVRRLSRDYLHTDPAQTVLLPNATTGINVALRSLSLTENDTVLVLNLTYGATKKIVRHLHSKTGCNVRIQELDIQKGHVPLDSQLQEAVREHHASVVILDHITSNTAVVLPIECMIKAVRAANPSVRVIVDAAHSLGAVPLDRMTEWGADFVTGNAHKWFCAAKGCAFLWIAENKDIEIDPLIVSHGHGSGLLSEFVWSGLRDYGPTLALHTAMDFWDAVGIEWARQQNHKLLLEAVGTLLAKWHTNTLAPLEMYQCMATVRVCGPSECMHESEHQELQDKLFENYKIEVPIKKIENVLYVRISCHLYNELQEYERLADAMLELRN